MQGSGRITLPRQRTVRTRQPVTGSPARITNRGSSSTPLRPPKKPRPYVPMSSRNANSTKIQFTNDMPFGETKP